MSGLIQQNSFKKQNTKDLEKELIIELKIPIINYINMNKYTSEFIIKTAENLIQEFHKNEIKYFKTIAENLKNEISRKYEGCWHVIVGKDFGSFVSFEKNSVIHFSINDFSFLIWKFC